MVISSNDALQCWDAGDVLNVQLSSVNWCSDSLLVCVVATLESDDT